MILQGEYAKITKDISGARSKNRFRNEIFWGIKKIYDLYESNTDDFFVILDYACDIEVGNNNSFSFFQLKTKDDGSNFTLANLIKKDKTKQSILSKLYSLNKSDCIDGLYIVSNAKFSCSNTVLSNSEVFCFSDLDDKEQLNITDHIQETLGIDVDLKKIFYAKSEFCITNPHTLLLGKTVEFLSNILKIKIMDPKYFYNYIKNVVEIQACCELETKTLDDTIDKKGIRRKEIDKIIDIYKNSIDLSSEKIIKKIEKFSDLISYNDYIGIKKSFKNFKEIGFESYYLKEIINKIKEEYKNNSELVGLKYVDVVFKLANMNFFDSIMSFSDKLCLIIVTLFYIEESEIH